MYHVSIKLYKHEWKFGRNVEGTSGRQVLLQLFKVFPNFHESFHKLMKHGEHVENSGKHCDEKGKQLVFFDHQNVISLCLCHHYINSLC